MINKVTVERFKRFKDPTEFEFHPTGVTYLAGGNNSGKSSILQALAIWDYARIVVKAKKGNASLLPGGLAKRLGIGIEEFTPVSVPDLRYLWFDLQAHRVMKIRVDWQAPTDPPVDRYLEFELTLTHQRLYIKPQSNLTLADDIPNVSYLPSFSGMCRHEERMTVAARRPLIGRGQAGQVLRNMVFDLHEANNEARDAAKNERGRIPPAALATLRRTDSYELLLLALEEVFKSGLSVAEFDEVLESALAVDAWDGVRVKRRFKRKPKEKPKEIMAQGSGFLQWLSVYCLAVDARFRVLLLDEPDAHLHPALQGHLIKKLGELAFDKGKQVLMTTHSPTVLYGPLEQIYRMEDRRYLTREHERVRLMEGLGTAYAPLIDQLKINKKALFTEGTSDGEVLRILATKLGLAWPRNLLIWQTNSMSDEARKALIEELKKEIPHLICISLHDRDELPYGASKADLSYRGQPLVPPNGIRRRLWRRRELENYLLCPALARVTGLTEADVNKELGVIIPANYKDSDCPANIRDLNAKELLFESASAVCTTRGKTIIDLANEMRAEEIPDDLRTLLTELAAL